MVHVPYDRQAWLSVKDSRPEPGFKELLLGENPYLKYRPLIAGLAREHQLDAVLLLVPASAYTGSLVKPEGLAVYTGGRSGNIRFAVAGIFAHLVLFNGVDGSEVEAAVLRGDPWQDTAIRPFGIALFNRRPVENLQESDLFFVAKLSEPEQYAPELGSLFKDLLEDAYLSYTVKDAVTWNWAVSSDDTSGND